MAKERRVFADMNGIVHAYSHFQHRIFYMRCGRGWPYMLGHMLEDESKGLPINCLECIAEGA